MIWLAHFELIYPFEPESCIVGNIESLTKLQKGNPTTTIYGIPFRKKMSKRFHDACYEQLGLNLTPVSFLDNAYFSKYVDTINPLPDADLPTTRNAKDLLFYLLELAEAHPLLQDLEAINKRSWKVLFEDTEKMTEGEEI